MAEQDKNFLDDTVLGPLVSFGKECAQLWKLCDKPNKDDIIKVMQATGMGFVILGGLGYLVKLVHIPINQILVSQ